MQIIDDGAATHAYRLAMGRITRLGQARRGQKWSKKDLKTLVQQLSSWWSARSMFLKSDVTLADVWDTMPLAVRMGAVVGELRDRQSMFAKRAHKDREMVEHYAGMWVDSGTPRDSDGTMRERFADLARQSEASASACQKLIDRVEAQGLPAEVAAWRPDR